MDPNASGQQWFMMYGPPGWSTPPAPPTAGLGGGPLPTGQNTTINLYMFTPGRYEVYLGGPNSPAFHQPLQQWNPLYNPQPRPHFAQQPNYGQANFGQANIGMFPGFGQGGLQNPIWQHPGNVAQFSPGYYPYSLAPPAPNPMYQYQGNYPAPGVVRLPQQPAASAFRPIPVNPGMPMNQEDSPQRVNEPEASGQAASNLAQRPASDDRSSWIAGIERFNTPYDIHFDLSPYNTP